MVYLLAAGLVFLFWRLHQHGRAVTRVRRSIEARQLILRDTLPRGKAGDWEGLIDAANAIVTDARRLDHLRKTQHSQLQATLDSIREAVLIVDEDHYVRLANPASAAILPNARIVGQRLDSMLHSAAFNAFVSEVRQGKNSNRKEFEFSRADKSLWLEVSAAPVVPLRSVEEVDAGRERAAPGEGAREPAPWTLFVLHDITRQKHLEAVRKDFVANVSHELRTPLSVIKGYVETLVDDNATMKAEDRLRFLTTVQRHSERLHRIVEDLLVLSRLESTTPNITCEDVDLASLIATVVQDYAAPTHHLRLSVSPDLPRLRLDPLRMTQVLGNLLDNALKYTPAGSTVTMAARALEAEVEITVADDGPGIAATDLPRLFERFYRVDKGRSRETGGTGLGLSIVKHIVQLHGGRVSVESRQAPTTDPRGSGTTFSLWLPIQAQARPDSPA